MEGGEERKGVGVCKDGKGRGHVRQGERREVVGGGGGG